MTWNCKKLCKKYSICVELDNCIVARQLTRIENPRRKGRIEIVYECEMDGTGHCRYVNCVWGESREE